MHKIRLIDYLLLIVGLGLVLSSIFLIKNPPTLRIVNIFEGFLLKLVVLSLGLILLVREGQFFFKKKVEQNKEDLHKKYNRDKRQKIAQNLILLVGFILFSIAVLEIFLQLTAQKGCRIDDPTLNHIYLPNCTFNFKTGEWNVRTQTNSLGLRDKEILPKEKDQYRILMLGDSFLAGYGVEQEEMYSEILQDKLVQSGIKVDIINTGVTSYSPILEYLYLKNKGLKLKPDMIILNLDMSDIQNDYFYEKVALFDEKKLPLAVPAQKNNLLYKLYTEIKVIKLLEIPLLILDAEFPPKKIYGEKYWYNLKYDRYAITRDGLNLTLEEEYWGPTLKYIQLLNKLSKENNITFILMTYPYGHQVSQNEWDTGRHNFGFERGKIYSDRPNLILKQFAKEYKIPFISLFSGFKEQKKSNPDLLLFFPYDGHFNPEGHKLAAEILYSELIKLNLLNQSNLNPKKVPNNFKIINRVNLGYRLRKEEVKLENKSFFLTENNIYNQLFKNTDNGK